MTTIIIMVLPSPLPSPLPANISYSNLVQWSLYVMHVQCISTFKDLVYKTMKYLNGCFYYYSHT